MEKIVASLKYGRIYGKRMKMLFVAVIFMGVLWIVVSTNLQSTKWVVLGIIEGILICCFGVYYLAKNYNLKKRVKIWEIDAIQLKACVYQESNSVSYNPLHIKIHLIFEYQNQTMKKISGTGKGQSGFDIMYKQFVNKEIDILYSPKYDEVMLLKPKK